MARKESDGGVVRDCHKNFRAVDGLMPYLKRDLRLASDRKRRTFFIIFVMFSFGLYRTFNFVGLFWCSGPYYISPCEILCIQV